MVDVPQLDQIEEIRKNQLGNNKFLVNMDMSELLVWMWYIMSGVFLGLILQSSRGIFI